MLTLGSFEALDGIVHGFFTREGGVSEGIYASLNCGLGSADDPAAVAENRARAMAGLGFEAEALAGVHQVHSSTVVEVETPWRRPDLPRADAMVTKRRGVCLGVLTADCVPVVLADPTVPVVGAAHAGWKGARNGVIEAAIQAMVKLGARPERIRVGVGPAIREASYEVGPEFPAQFAGAEHCFRPSSRPEHFLFDLPGYVRGRLSRLGLASIEDLGLDTYADEGRFFSYRRATHRGERDYGRMLSAVALS